MGGRDGGSLEGLMDDGWMTDSCLDAWMVGWMVGWWDGGMDGRMDRWMMDRQMMDV